jgi:hypothetical protein
MLLGTFENNGMQVQTYNLDGITESQLTIDIQEILYYSHKGPESELSNSYSQGVSLGA